MEFAIHFSGLSNWIVLTLNQTYEVALIEDSYVINVQPMFI